MPVFFIPTGVKAFRGKNKSTIFDVKHWYARVAEFLDENELIRRDLPEPLNNAVANQLLMATTCALIADDVTEHPTQCYGGTLEKSGKNRVFFEASPNHTVSSTEWQVQASSSESLELNLNSTTQLILTLDESGVIVKGDVVTFEKPSDMMEEDDKNKDDKAA